MKHLHSGKVRDLYETEDGNLLMVASDRISAYDWIMPTPIPDKGKILTQMSLWWFDQLKDLVPNHVISATDVPEEFVGRGLLCQKLDMLPVECVARGYLTGSGLVDYNATGAVCGVELPPGLIESSRLEQPIFTPATKAAVGEHDENVSYEAVAATVGEDLAAELKRLTLQVYSRAADIARERGIILADTKFEFGRDASGNVVLADEVLTPDSSRFWPADAWEPGHVQASFDKQYLRDWLTKESGWDRNSEPPELPLHVVEGTRAKYVEAYERLTGQTWEA